MHPLRHQAHIDFLSSYIVVTLYSSQSVSISLCAIDLNVAFDRFGQVLEQPAGRFDPAAFPQAGDSDSAQALIKRMEGE
jgi:hypothetical protein